MKNFVKTLTVLTAMILLIATFSLSAMAAQPEETQAPTEDLYQQMLEQYYASVEQQEQEHEDTYAQQVQEQMDWYYAMVEAQEQQFQQSKEENQQWIDRLAQENQLEVQQAYEDAMDDLNRHMAEGEKMVDAMVIVLLVLGGMLLVVRIIVMALILGAASGCGRTKAWALVALASAAAGIVILVFMRGRWRRR